MTTSVPHRVRWVVGVLVGLVVVAACWSSSFLDEGSHRWAIVAIVAVAVLVAECLPELEAVLPWPGAVTIALLLPLAAVYGCVPETDQLPPIGVLLATVGAVEIITRHRRGVVWHAVAAALVLWGAVYGAVGRDRAFVGGLFAFWPVVLVAAIVFVMPKFGRAAPVARAAVFVVGGAAAIIVARTGALEVGRSRAARDTLVAGGVSLVAAFAIALLAIRATRSRQKT